MCKHDWEVWKRGLSYKGILLAVTGFIISVFTLITIVCVTDDFEGSPLALSTLYLSIPAIIGFGIFFFAECEFLEQKDKYPHTKFRGLFGHEDKTCLKCGKKSFKYSKQIAMKKAQEELWRIKEKDKNEKAKIRAKRVEQAESEYKQHSKMFTVN